MRRLATTLLRWLALAVVRLYYPRRSMEGSGHLPPGGPTLYVANHPNGLMDPLLLRAVTGRRIRFLAKSTFWHNPFGRLAMDAFQTLKVYRQQDFPGEGTGAGGAAAPGSAPGTRDRNEETFARCRAALAAGAELALYPEGMSHSEPRLKPLKSGAARIALSAAAEAVARGGPVPTLVPVASHYEDKSIFRSGVHLVIGAPIDLPAVQATFAADPRHGIDELTALIRGRLEALVLQAETHDLLEGIARIARSPAVVTREQENAGEDEGPAWRARTRALLDGYARLKVTNPARLEEITRPARQYARVLERLGVAEPWAVELPLVTMAGAGKAIARALLLAPAGVWGIVTSWLPYRLAGVVAGRMTRDDDILSTIKMITGFAFLTGTWLIEAVVIGVWAGAGWGITSFLFAPLAGYAALRLGETLRGVTEAIRHIGWGSRAATARRLTERRRRLAEELAGALREAAP